MHTKFKQHPINIKIYTAHPHDMYVHMVHIPAKFPEIHQCVFELQCKHFFNPLPHRNVLCPPHQFFFLIDKKLLTTSHQYQKQLQSFGKNAAMRFRVSATTFLTFFWEKKNHKQIKHHINIKNYTAHPHEMVHIPANKVSRKYSNAFLSYSPKTKRDGQMDRQMDILTETTFGVNTFVFWLSGCIHKVTINFMEWSNFSSFLDCTVRFTCNPANNI